MDYLVTSKPILLVVMPAAHTHTRMQATTVYLDERELGWGSVHGC